MRQPLVALLLCLASLLIVRPAAAEPPKPAESAKPVEPQTAAVRPEPKSEAKPAPPASKPVASVPVASAPVATAPKPTPAPPAPKPVAPKPAPTPAPSGGRTPAPSAAPAASESPLGPAWARGPGPRPLRRCGAGPGCPPPPLRLPPAPEAPAAAAATKAPQAEVTPAEVLARIVSFERRERYRSTVLNKMLVILLELARDRLGDQRMTEERRKFLSDLIHENIIWAERVSDGDGERMPGGFSDDTMTIVFGRTDGHPLDGWQDF